MRFDSCPSSTIEIEMTGRRIGILTGGGDVPGLNSVIKEVVYRATENNSEVVGIRRGWEGLTHVRLDDPASRDLYIHAAHARKHPHHRSLRRHRPAFDADQSFEE